MANKSKERLNDLFNRMVDVMHDVLDGEPTASDLNTIRQFLKDNQIDVMSQPGDSVDQLKNKVLPFPKHTGEEDESYG